MWPWRNDFSPTGPIAYASPQVSVRRPRGYLITQYNLDELEAWLIECGHEELMAFSALMLVFATLKQ